MPQYDEKLVNELWNAGYSLGKTIEEQTSYSQSMRYLNMLNEYREHNYNKFKDYLMSLYIETHEHIPEAIPAMLKSELTIHQYSVIFCMGWIGEKKTVDQL